MKNQSSDANDGKPTPAKGQGEKTPMTNVQRETGSKPASPSAKPASENKQGMREAEGAQRNEQAHRTDPTRTSDKPAPRLDDRPSQSREEGKKSGKQPSPDAALPNRGTPNYGDTEPNDPRKLDVDAGKGGRGQSGDHSNKS